MKTNNNETLILTEDVCLMLTNKGLIQLGMTMSNQLMHYVFNQRLRSETQYDSEVLRETVQKKVPFLNQRQKYVYNKFTLVKKLRNFFFRCSRCNWKNIFDIADFGNNLIEKWNSLFLNQVAIEHAN